MAEITVATLNMLLGSAQEYSEYVPQVERLDAIVAGFAELNTQWDAVFLSEVGVSDGQPHGIHIARQLVDSPGVWHPHARRDEHMGMFGAQLDDAQLIENGASTKKSVMTKLDSESLVVAGLHPRYGVLQTFSRQSHVQTVLDAVGDAERAVVMGDFNEPELFGVARRSLKQHGFLSVFDALEWPRRPVTSPTPEYRRQLPLLRRAVVAATLRGGFNVDDIYVRGVDVKEAGIIETASDHYGVWAKLEV